MQKKHSKQKKNMNKCNNKEMRDRNKCMECRMHYQMVDSSDSVYFRYYCQHLLIYKK